MKLMNKTKFPKLNKEAIIGRVIALCIETTMRTTIQKKRRNNR